MVSRGAERGEPPKEEEEEEATREKLGKGVGGRVQGVKVVGRGGHLQDKLKRRRRRKKRTHHPGKVWGWSSFWGEGKEKGVPFSRKETMADLGGCLARKRQAYLAGRGGRDGSVLSFFSESYSSPKAPGERLLYKGLGSDCGVHTIRWTPA